MGLLLTDYAPWLVLAVASVGNVLGSVVNWFLGGRVANVVEIAEQRAPSM